MLRRNLCSMYQHRLNNVYYTCIRDFYSNINDEVMQIRIYKLQLLFFSQIKLHKHQHKNFIEDKKKKKSDSKKKKTLKCKVIA